MPDAEVIRPKVFHPFVDVEAIRLQWDMLEEIADPDDVFAEMTVLLSYMPELLAEISRLYERMAAERLRYANLLAAVLSALSADRDGESDPLSYVRSELAFNPAHDWRGRRR